MKMHRWVLTLSIIFLCCTMVSSLSSAQENSQETAKMIKAYKQKIRKNPDDFEAHRFLGHLYYYELKRYQEAIKSYKQVIRIKPDDALAYVGLGMGYDNLKHYQEAIKAYKQAIHISPDYVKAHYNLGLVYLYCLKDPGSALGQYKILKDMDKDLAEKLYNEIHK